MRNSGRAAMVLGLLAFALAPLVAQVPDSSKGVKAVMAAESAWWQAEMKGDTATMSRYMAPDYVSVYAGQGALDRAGTLAMTRADEPGETEEVGNWHLMDYGTTIVATASYITVEMGQTGPAMVFDTWMNRGKGWQVVFSVVADVPNSPAGN